MPQGPIPVLSNEAGSNAKNYTANNTGDQIFKGIGIVDSVIIGSPGVTSTVTLYDGTSASGANLGVFATTAQISLTLLIQIRTGLFAVLAGGTPANVTVTYRT